MAASSLFTLAVFCLTISIVLINGEVVDDLSCANHVHKECKCTFLKFVSGPLDKTLCSKLQSCAKCLQVPRCRDLKYLRKYINLLLLTLKLVKKTKICHHIEYRKLLRLFEGHVKCNPARKRYYIYDECGHRCQCDQGFMLSRTRIRKEFTEMSFDERRRFVDAYYKASTDPYYKADFEKLLNVHSEIPSQFLHHMPTIFFPWHRWHVLKIENFLRRIDCRVTVPFYQWTARVDDKTVWRTSDPKDVWHGGPAGLGGNGVKPSLCVEDGRFRKGMWSMPYSKGGGCLKRNFNFHCDLYNQARTDKLLRGSFHDFEFTVREEHHAAFHDCIGGNMPDNRVASTAPEYVLHHGFMDKLWDSFQKRGLPYKYAYYPSINFRMPFADMRGIRFLDNDNLPGGVAVAYQDMKRHRRYKGKPYKDEAVPGPDLSWEDEDAPIKIRQSKDSNVLSQKDTSSIPSFSRKDANVMAPDLSHKDKSTDDPGLSPNDKTSSSDSDFSRKDANVLDPDSKSGDKIDLEFEF